MSLKSLLSRPLSAVVTSRIRQLHRRPYEVQHSIFHHLISVAQNTAFGKEHSFGKIKNYYDFKKAAPLRDYEGIRPYIERIEKGEQDVLWKGRPIYFCKTSGTTSGIKYIPVTSVSMPHHIRAARNALLFYIAGTGKSAFVDGKMIFLQGSPRLEKHCGIPTGRLSGIVAHHVPRYLQRNRMPSFETNCIDDWEQKVDAIIEETLHEDMRLISGIPPWVQMYFDKLLKKTGKQAIADVFPNFSLFVHGGVNFEPYRLQFEKTIGRKLDMIETYPASEGFFAFQDLHPSKGLLLNINGGIFYEFVPAGEALNKNPSRLWLQEVEVGENYALVLNTDAGLWGYQLGDTVKFVSKKPYRLVVTGRIAHFISAFGEHVIAEEVESAMQRTAAQCGVKVVEFHVSPQINPPSGEKPYHEWFVEFADRPTDVEKFRKMLDEAMQKKNIYYRDLITGSILQILKITSVRKNGFIEYMKSLGKLGGQNKVPRLANDRHVADELKKYVG